MVKGPRSYSCEFGTRTFKNECVVAITHFFPQQSGLRNMTKFQVALKRGQLPPCYTSQCYKITGATYNALDVGGKISDVFSSKVVIVENA